ncbi:MAG TPA: hypothetical protein VMT21_04650 [Gemmatimonadales bacterium]|nr:hypothetical protein [Gemmatimonadales bacterium]
MRTLIAAVIALGAAACGDILSYSNPNSPDKTLALSRPTDVENLISGAYNTAYNAMHGTAAALGVQMLSASFESYSALGNYNMGVRAAMPRVSIDNSRGAPPSENPGSAYDYLRLERAARAAALGLQSLNRTGFTTGSAARDARARSFAHFVKGFALGNLALAYDSGAVVTEYDDPTVVPPLVSYDSLMKVALSFLDSAITIAGGTAPAGSASDWFPLPGTWMDNRTPASMSAANFVALLRGLKARFRAEVARTPAERAAVNWAAVVADGQAALGTDFVLNLNSGSGWGEAIIGNLARYGNWAQGNFFMLAFADTSHTGTVYQFDTWLATTPVYNRQPFLVRTPDLRFPAGATRTVQSAVAAPAGTFGFPYYSNRAAVNDACGDAITCGYYDHFRFIVTMNAANQVGPWTFYTRAETNLLIAEGLIRQNQIASALPWIDSTRVRAGLPSLVAAAIPDTLTRVPGGTACVPRVPDAAQSYKGTICGNLWEALKYEMRLETAFTGWGEWYFHERGWGDLPEGTPFHWPVPYSEMDARVHPFYNMGGVGLPGGSAKGTYGLWGGGLY